MNGNENEAKQSNETERRPKKERRYFHFNSFLSNHFGVKFWLYGQGLAASVYATKLCKMCIIEAATATTATRSSVIIKQQLTVGCYVNFFVGLLHNQFHAIHIPCV